MKSSIISRLLFALLFLAPIIAVCQELQVPVVLEKCLENRQADGILEIASSRNPYYLRGDFDGDGKPDHAVSIAFIKSKGPGILLCLGSENVVVVEPTNQVPASWFLAPLWVVRTRAEIIAMNQPNFPPLPVPKGEAISLFFEDGTRYLYWDGNRFLWSPTYQ